MLAIGTGRCIQYSSTMSSTLSSIYLLLSAENEWIKTFLQSETVDDQLSILKTELNKLKDPVDANIVKLLVVIFFHSEAKHPVKCFLTRYFKNYFLAIY